MSDVYERTQTPEAMTPSKSFTYTISDQVLQVVLHEPPADLRQIPEALIHDLWLHQRFANGDLTTVDGAPVMILAAGRHNHDAGPDFLDARLRIGSTLWSGAVEIHTTSGIWIDHGHDHDERYNSTILHVVLYNDMWTGRLHRPDGTPLPELVLYPHLDAPLRRLLHSFYTRRSRHIFCASGWSRVPEVVRTPYLRRLALERMLDKRRALIATGNLETGLYHGILAGLGYSKNAAAMRALACSVSLSQVRSLEAAFDVEALFLGVSGLIPAPSDLLDADRETADYAMDLRDRFERLNHRFGIEPMPATSWRFFRLRPANFPPLRIAQAAALFHPETGLLSKEPIHRLRAALGMPDPLGALRALFAVELSPFWSNHVRLDRRTPSRSAAIGRERIDALLVNVILPALAESPDGGPAFALLERLKSPDDEVLKPFRELGTEPASALEAQGLHQLYRTRCAEAKCLSCDIGAHLLAGNL